MILIDSSAASVRKVTSAQGRPPSTNAFARGAASFASSRTTTGTTPNSANFSAAVLIILPPYTLFVSYYEMLFHHVVYLYLHYTTVDSKVKRFFPVATFF